MSRGRQGKWAASLRSGRCGQGSAHCCSPRPVRRRVRLWPKALCPGTQAAQVASSPAGLGPGPPLTGAERQGAPGTGRQAPHPVSAPLGSPPCGFWTSSELALPRSPDLQLSPRPQRARLPVAAAAVYLQSAPDPPPRGEDVGSPADRWRFPPASRWTGKLSRLRGTGLDKGPGPEAVSTDLSLGVWGGAPAGPAGETQR